MFGNVAIAAACGKLAASRAPKIALVAIYRTSDLHIGCWNSLGTDAKQTIAQVDNDWSLSDQ